MIAALPKTPTKIAWDIEIWEPEQDGATFIYEELGYPNRAEAKERIEEMESDLKRFIRKRNSIFGKKVLRRGQAFKTGLELYQKELQSVAYTIKAKKRIIRREKKKK